MFYEEAVKIISQGNGIEVCVSGVTVHLDPKRAEGISFVSHAHSDHRPSTCGGRILTSHQTKFLSDLKADGVDYGERVEINGLGFRVLPSGHILGSGQLLIENGFRIIYSGDLNLRGGATTEEAVVEKGDVLVVESTYGSPYYRFPKREEVIKEIKDWADDTLAKGKTPFLLAYSIGKAQELTKYLSGGYDLAVHHSIYSNNKKYEELGVSLGKYSLFNGKTNGNTVVIAPPCAAKTKEGDSRTAMVSGWAVHGVNFGADEAFPLSDHSDFDELVEYVERVNPQIVYTVHGFCEEFSEELKSRGFYSEPIDKKDQMRIEEFI